MSEAVKEKNSELVSKRWAKALMELCNENTSISKEEVLGEIRGIASTISESEDLSSVISDPSISTEEKQIVLCKLFQERVTPLVYNFLFVLNLKKRVNLISQIADEFEKELAIMNNIINISVTSAIDLSDEKKEEIKSKVAQKLDKNVNIDWSVDKEIIAGLVFNIDETVVDNSIKHKLEDLSKVIMR